MIDPFKQMSINDFLQLLKSNKEISLIREAWDKIKVSHLKLQEQQNNQIIYGVNTGFGSLISTLITKEYLHKLQKNLVRSHTVGFPPYHEERISRAIFLCRILVLSRGYSGASPQLIKRLILLYNKKVSPAISLQGSLGASGDLGPLSSLALLIIGEGKGIYRGKLYTSKEIHRRLNIKPYKLLPKEGLSLINGTSAMLAIGIISILEFKKVFSLSLISVALMLYVTGAPLGFINDNGLLLRAHKYVRQVGDIIRNILGDQNNMRSSKLQSVYSFRIIPFVLASFLNALDELEKVLEIELISVTDNPLILETDIYHGANFHGLPISVAMDRMAVAVPQLSSLLDRQLDFVLDNRNQDAIAPFLAFDVKKGHSGLEGAQYLLTSLHIENVSDSNPMNVRSLPTNAGNQDIVSLGYQSAIRLHNMARKCRQAICVHLLAGVQAAYLGKAEDLPKMLISVINHLSKSTTIPYKDQLSIQEVLESIDNCLDDLYEKTKHLASDLIGANKL